MHYETLIDLCINAIPVGVKVKDHWLIDEEGDLNTCDELVELLQTGSVTTTVAGKRYILALTVQEE